MSLCEHCIKGALHEGTASGKWEKIGGIDSYVATPTGDYAEDKIVLLLPDIFGPQLINSQLLADGFAENGFKTVIPDFLNGDPVPPVGLTYSPDFDLAGWFAKHTQAETRPPLDKVINALKEQGVTTFGATGYCFGPRYVFDLAFENIIKVAVVAHPSLLKIPDDLEKYRCTSKAPLLINSCEFDSQFPIEAQAQADEILGDGKFAPGYKRNFYPGCTHGFAVRGDLSDPKVKTGKEGAFKETVEWFIKYL